jgi:hypothetical protein
MARNLLKAGFRHRRISTGDDHCSYRPIRELVNVGVRSGCIRVVDLARLDSRSAIDCTPRPIPAASRTWSLAMCSGLDEFVQQRSALLVSSQGASSVTAQLARPRTRRSAG